MTKPIGYWTNYTPGNKAYLGELENKCGSYFEGMNKPEKLFLLACLADNLYHTASGEIRQEVFTVGPDALAKLAAEDQEGLIEALIHQIWWGG